MLATLAAWLGSLLLPGVETDGQATSFFLFGLFVAIGEVVLPVIEGGAALLLFFLPRHVRAFALRLAVVGISAHLVGGFSLSDRPAVPLLGMTLLLSLLYMLPFAH